MKRNGTEDLKAAIEAYFAACDATKERWEHKNGAVSYRQVPYTLAGLSAAIGRSEQSIREAVRGQGGKAEQKLLSDAVRKIAQHLSERALLGELTASVAMPLIHALGIDGENGQDGANRLTVVMDDREGWSE